MTCTVVVGTQWGDEGKGKIVDLLTAESDAVVRYQGGNNAGHTVMYEDKTIVLHLIPSGILQGKESILGNGVVIEPNSLLDEIKGLINAGYNVENNLKISSQAHLVMPYHQMFDTLKEISKGDKKIGTTCRGIGPTYEDKVGRVGLRICDLNNDNLKSKLKEILEIKKIEFELFDRFDIDYNINLENLYKNLKDFYNKIKDYIIDSSDRVNDLIDENKNIIFEGAQGTFLDVDHGTYPYVTSSNTLAGAACVGSGIGPTKINRVIGITKAYATRVGSGPFPTELKNQEGEYLRKVGNEFGATTGRPRRCGWFDSLLVKHAVRLNGITDIALTKLDVLDSLDHIKICTGYVLPNGELIDRFTYDGLEEAMPQYHVMSGWKTNTKGMTSKDQLPFNLLLYIEKIEWLIKANVSIISTGPKREETIIL